MAHALVRAASALMPTPRDRENVECLRHRDAPPSSPSRRKVCGARDVPNGIVPRSWAPHGLYGQSVAIALLENLVHMSRQDYPSGYVIVAVTIPDHVVILDQRIAGNSAGLGMLHLSALGDYWFDARLSAVLRVRSAVVPSDFNYLLNPQHLDFAQIAVRPSEPFRFDPRLFESA